MGLQGSLLDLSVADLIQQNCMDGKSVKLVVQNGEKQAEILIREGNLIHAQMDDLIGEEVVYEVLGWEDGRFWLDSDVTDSSTTVHRKWSVLLLEGAKRLDEQRWTVSQNNSFWRNDMAQLDDLLKQMAGEINGFVAAEVVGMDGLSVATFARGKANLELIGAQLTLLIKLVDTSVEKLNSGVLNDFLLTTENNFTMMRLLPDKKHFIAIIADRKTSNLGNLRLVSQVYLDRIRTAMPH